MTCGLFQSLRQFSRIQLCDCSRCLGIPAGSQIGGELCVILGEGVRNGASLCVAQFRGPRKSLLKFGEGSESFSERFGGCRELLLGFLELLGNVVKLPINFCLTLRDFADLLQ